MLRLTLLLLAFATIVAQAGCGQSGPLFLPDDPSTMVEPPAAGEDEDEDEDDSAQDAVTDRDAANGEQR